jgi:hypothetical protein
MKKNEATASARRIGPLYAADEDGNAITGETFADAGECEVMLNGTDWAAPTGAIVEIGDGYYYYQATEAESANPWIAVKLAVVCEEFTFRENVERVPAGIKVGESDATKKRIGPLLAVDEDGNAVTGETFEDAGELEVSINGATWDAAAGTITEASDGYYYYTPDTATELVARGWLAVKLAGACEEFTLREDVIDDEVSPVVTWVSPTPGVAPGQAGGFPADPSAAKVYPITIQIGDANPGVHYINVVVVYTDADGVLVEETIYRRSNFRGRFITGSKAEMVGADLQPTIKRNGGWLELLTGVGTQFAIYADVVDAAGNLSAEE